MDNIFNSWFYDGIGDNYFEGMTREELIEQVLDDIERYENDCGENEFSNLTAKEIGFMWDEYDC